MTEEKQMLSIGEASEEIDLPESTIRYYDKEFGDYLSIPRGKNNQRLFADEHLQDLEYIRYLIKREELSVEEVRTRLGREDDYRESDEDENEGPSDSDGSADEQPQGPEFDQASADVLDTIVDRLEQIDARLEELEQRQDRVEELLDLNLQRYNKLVEDL